MAGPGESGAHCPAKIFAHFVPAKEEAVSSMGDRSIKVLKANARRRVWRGQYPWRSLYASCEP